MKRVDLIKKLKAIGCIFIRHGGKHDWYQNPNTKMAQLGTSPHPEINGNLAKNILRKLKG